MKKHSAQKGFTIVESLVAIAVLVLAITGTMSAVQSGISSYTYSKDQVIATYLAQEGIEQLRNMRDENALNSRDWLNGIAANSSDPCYFGQACMVSPIESGIATRCSFPGACSYLRQDPTDGFYGYNGSWTLTPFRREITLESVNSNEIVATVTIYWTKGANNRQFKIKENILNWQ
jgi:prepilin-type N-terminal cleavage/methylation domain-containing protein